MRLGKNGQIIADTGFDGGSYEPRYESRTSVYLGDMTKEDIRIKAEVANRARSARILNAEAAKLKAQAARQRMVVKSRMHELINAREALATKQMELVRAHQYEAARRSSRMGDFNPWIGNPLAGFGQIGEVRIDPDSHESVQIADADIPSVKEYGINNWLEDPSYYEDKVESSENAYTPGKRTLQTMVDYAKSPELSVVGMPVAAATNVERQEDAATAYVEANAKSVVAVQAGAPNNTLTYGLMALAAWMLLRR